MNSQVYKQVIGEEPNDIKSQDIQQHYEDTCAIKSQQIVLERFGIDITEEKLVQEAEQLNIYSPGRGTQPQDVGKLLELNGVSCTQHANASIYDLTAALAKGEQVIIGVNSSDLWDKGSLHHFISSFQGDHADHALVVAGIDTSDPQKPQVILTDPGTGQEGARYPLDQFMDAWHDSGNFMVTTDSPIPQAYNLEQMANFDYTAGHLSMIGQMPFDFLDSVACPISHFAMDPAAAALYYQDIQAMIQGESSSFSPEFIDAYNDYMHEVQDASFPEWNISLPMYDIEPCPSSNLFEPVSDLSPHPVIENPILADFYHPHHDGIINDHGTGNDSDQS